MIHIDRLLEECVKRGATEIRLHPVERPAEKAVQVGIMAMVRSAGDSPVTARSPVPII